MGLPLEGVDLAPVDQDLPAPLIPGQGPVGHQLDHLRLGGPEQAGRLRDGDQVRATAPTMARIVAGAVRPYSGPVAGRRIRTDEEVRRGLLGFGPLGSLWHGPCGA
jgi:hypothetical protein